MIAGQESGEGRSEGCDWTAAEQQLLALFGARVRGLRKETGGSIAMLASKAGIDASYLGELERGRKNVSLLTAARISAALGVTLQALLSED